MTREPSKSPGILRVIERRLRIWELQGGQSPAPLASPILRVHPYVTISRETGSGAREIADQLSARLGWPLYDKEILDHMAVDDDVRRRLYALIDEQGENFLDEILRPLTLGSKALRSDYFRRLRAAIGTIAAHESAIFLGRGAAYQLPMECGLQVRIVAPRDARIARVAARLGLDAVEAAEQIEQTELHRRQFLESHFGPDPYRTDRFDLTLNTGRLSIEQAAEVILAAVRSKTPGLRAL